MTAATSPTWIDFMATLLAVGAPGATGRGDDIMAFGQCRFRYRAPQANRAAGYKPCLFHRYLGIDDHRGVGALFYSAKARCRYRGHRIVIESGRCRSESAPRSHLFDRRDFNGLLCQPTISAETRSRFTRMTAYSRSSRGASVIQKGQHDDLTAHVNRRLSSSANSWSSSAHQLGKGCTMNTLHPACKVTLVRNTSAKCDFSQAMLSIAYKLNCTLQSEMHDVTVRSHAHSAGEYASEVERTAPCYSSERGDLDRL